MVCTACFGDSNANLRPRLRRLVPASKARQAKSEQLENPPWKNSGHRGRIRHARGRVPTWATIGPQDVTGGGDSIAVFVLGFLGLEFVAIPTKGTATMGVV